MRWNNNHFSSINDNISCRIEASTNTTNSNSSNPNSSNDSNSIKRGKGVVPVSAFLVLFKLLLPLNLSSLWHTQAESSNNISTYARVATSALTRQ